MTPKLVRVQERERERERNDFYSSIIFSSIHTKALSLPQSCSSSFHPSVCRFKAREWSKRSLAICHCRNEAAVDMSTVECTALIWHESGWKRENGKTCSKTNSITAEYPCTFYQFKRNLSIIKFSERTIMPSALTVPLSCLSDPLVLFP